MKKYSPESIQKYGENALMVNFETAISLDLLKSIKAYCENLREHLPEAVDIQNTYNAILINCANLRQTDKRPSEEEIAEILDSTSVPQKIKAKRFELPVCYDQEFGLDLDDLAREKNTTPERIIEWHKAKNYTVFFTGFLPGFLYLGGLDKRLHHPRKAEPRLQVAKGAVGIAGEQTGIYPQASAGGWQLIGNCPVNLFSAEQEPPVFCRPGDQLKFKAVSKAEHRDIQTAVENNAYTINSEDYEF